MLFNNSGTTILGEELENIETGMQLKFSLLTHVRHKEKCVALCSNIVKKN